MNRLSILSNEITLDDELQNNQSNNDENNLITNSNKNLSKPSRLSLKSSSVDFDSNGIYKSSLNSNRNLSVKSSTFNNLQIKSYKDTKSVINDIIGESECEDKNQDKQKIINQWSIKSTNIDNELKNINKNNDNTIDEKDVNTTTKKNSDLRDSDIKDMEKIVSSYMTSATRDKLSIDESKNQLGFKSNRFKYQDDDQENK